MNQHKAYRPISASIWQHGTTLRWNTWEWPTLNMPWARQGESIPVWCNGMCVIGSWERQELKWEVRCCFDGMRVYGNKSGKLGVAQMSTVVADCVTRRGGQGHGLEKWCLCRTQGVAVASHLWHHLPLPPLPVLAGEQRSVNSRSIAELFSLCNSRPSLMRCCFSGG